LLPSTRQESDKYSIPVLLMLNIYYFLMFLGKFYEMRNELFFFLTVWYNYKLSFTCDRLKHNPLCDSSDRLL